MGWHCGFDRDKAPSHSEPAGRASSGQPGYRVPNNDDGFSMMMEPS